MVASSGGQACGETVTALLLRGKAEQNGFGGRGSPPRSCYSNEAGSRPREIDWGVLIVRIVHFLASTGEGGDALAALALARGQNLLGHDARIAICHGAKSDSFCERALHNGVAAIDLRTLPNEHTGAFVSRAGRFRQTFASIAPDVLHMHTGTLAIRGADVFGARLVSSTVRVVTVHSPFRWSAESTQARIRWRLAARMLDHVITPSRSSREEQLRAGIADTKVTSLPNAVDLDRHARGRREATRASFGFGPDERVVLFLARIEKQKRPLDALAIFRDVAKRVPNLRMLIVGTGDLENDCRRFIDDAGLASAVVMTGHRTDVPDLMRASDVYLLPTEAESFGLTLVEAMAAGIPVVTSRISPLVDEVVPPDCALFADVGNIGGFANGVVSLLESKDLRRVLSERARKEVRKRYALEIVAQQHIDLYARVAK